MTTESKLGFGDKLKHKLHLGKHSHHVNPNTLPELKEPTLVQQAGQAPPQHQAGHGAHSTGVAADQGRNLPSEVPKKAASPGHSAPPPTDDRVEFMSLPGAAPVPIAINTREPHGQGTTATGLQGSLAPTPELPKHDAPHSQQAHVRPGDAFPALDGKQELVADASPHTSAAGGSPTALAAAKPQVTDVGVGIADPLTSPAKSTQGGGSVTKGGPDANATQGGQQASDVAQDATGSVAESARQAGSAAVEKARAALSQAQVAASPYLSSVAVGAQQLSELGREKATQAFSAVSNELDARGVNQEASQQKLNDIGQAVKDYGVAGQERASEYLQRAAEEVQTLSKSSENRSIAARVLGCLVLIWLAFGVSLPVLFVLGITTLLVLVLSRYSRPGGRAQGTGYVRAQTGDFRQPSGSGGVETHYPAHPQGIHPDASIANSRTPGHST